MTDGQRRIGFICSPDHEVFSRVAERLTDRGLDTVFFEPGVTLSTNRLDDLSLLVNKKMRWESLQALAYAHRTGIPAWNGYVTTMIFVNRLSQLAALAAVGFAVPDVRPEKPDGNYVAKGFFDIHETPTINGEGDFYQPLLDFDGTDFKYYAVDDGQEVHTAVTRYESKFVGERAFLGQVDADPHIESRIRQLLRFTDAQALGVDVITVEGDPYAIDVNTAPSFRKTELDEAIVDSITAVI